MKTKIFTFTVLLFLISGQAFAKKQYILLGGGGEPAGSTTIFDGDLQRTREYLNKIPDWQKEVSFNGGHTQTESILSKDFTDSNVSNFTGTKYKEIINKYINQLNSGEFAKGDQILIQIDSHGAMKFGQQDTHSISTARNALQNYDTLGGVLADLDELKKLTTLAKEKGVRVGIIDQSCHSGNSLGLADDNTCVLSVTGPNHYGFAGPGTDSDKLTEGMTPGKNLEDLFLEARRTSNDSGFPMISSPAGKAVQEQLYGMLTPYLYYFDKKSDKLTPFITGSQEDLVCKYDKDFEQLNQMINNVEDIQVVTKRFLFFKWDETTKKADLSALKKALADYYSFQKEILKDTAGIDLKIFDTSEKISVTGGSYVQTIDYTWKELISIDYDRIISDANVRLSQATNDFEKDSLKLNIELYKKAKKRGEEISIQHPEYKALQTKLARIEDKESKSYSLANTVGRESRALYEELYKKAKDSEATSSQPNPCKEFTL